ncbi:MAG: hypothetical protein R3D88_05705 [Alphaproteobacteria bacterium]|nr:hypothetical protein [Alphaproteobacteria bacterium]
MIKSALRLVGVAATAFQMGCTDETRGGGLITENPNYNPPRQTITDAEIRNEICTGYPNHAAEIACINRVKRANTGTGGLSGVSGGNINIDGNGNIRVALPGITLNL